MSGCINPKSYTTPPKQVEPATDETIVQMEALLSEYSDVDKIYRVPLLALIARIKAEREQTKEDCADFVKHWLIESDNEYAVKVAVECSHALLEWDGKS